MPRTTLNLLAVALALAITTPADAIGDHVDVQIVDRTTGETLTPVLHDGQWWVAGRPGAKYRVALVNRDGRRTLNVLAIDGVNAISGDTASWDQTGYVIDPYQRTGIDGWRKSMDEVAAFAFAALPDSYAALTGRPGNVGVIGVAVFDERPRIVPANGVGGPARATRPSAANTTPDTAPPAIPSPPLSTQTSPAEPGDTKPSAPRSATPKADALVQRDRLGTAHGEIESSSIRYVAFQRAQRTPDEIITIHYDRLENLVAMGIVPGPAATSAPVAVNAFPNSPHFVPDPPRR